MAVQHYENFPVASWLCPARLRPPIKAIYWFARTADDIADEGDAAASLRLEQLALYRQCLTLSLAGQVLRPEQPWSRLFNVLAQQIQRHGLPGAPLHALLDAFEQDVRNPAYADRAALLRYCGCSANPIGRLLLHLYGVTDARSLALSDAICSALQLTNFWQDLGQDLRRGRSYLTQTDLDRHGLQPGDLSAGVDSAAMQALVADLVGWTQTLMHQGSPLALQLPGRMGWELRLVVQGGLRVLETIQRMQFRSLNNRPVLGWCDGPIMLWRAWRMTARAAS